MDLPEIHAKAEINKLLKWLSV